MRGTRLGRHRQRMSDPNRFPDGSEYFKRVESNCPLTFNIWNSERPPTMPVFTKNLTALTCIWRILSQDDLAEASG